MPATLESFTKWITERKEEHFQAQPGSPGFMQRMDDLYRYLQTEYVINEYVVHLHQTSEVTPGGSSPIREVLEHDLPGMWERTDFLGGQDVSR